MFSKIIRTAYPPQHKPVLIWDGECGFCEFWIKRMKQYTGNNIDYKKFQNAAYQFPDISLIEFKKASRLIECDGSVFSGPDSFYKGQQYFDRTTLPLHSWYTTYDLFTKISDSGYNLIAKHRPFMFDLTKALFGKNPKRFRPYWLLYIVVLIAVIILLFN